MDTASPGAGPSRLAYSPPSVQPPSPLPELDEDQAPAPSSPRQALALSPRQRAKMPIPLEPTTGSTDHTHLSPPPHTAPLSSASTHLRRSASDEGTQRSRAYTAPTLSRGPASASSSAILLNRDEAALLQLARLKVSSEDQEAMRRIRSTMGELGISASASASSAALAPDTAADDAQARRDRRVSTRGGTQAPTPATFDYTIAVVGARGAGKSTFIQRSTRAWESTPMVSGETTTTCYTYVQPGGKLREPRVVRFVEVCADSVAASDSELDLWPEGVLPVTGVVMCYDATDPFSLTRFEVLLDRMARQSLPIIMLACKTDPDTTPAVTAAFGNSLGEPHNIGLIEVTTETAEGKSKMRNGLRWLLYKLEQRARRSRRSLHRLHIVDNQSPTKPGPGDLVSPAAESRLAPSTSGQSLLQHVATAHAVEEETDHRSSGSSLQWMMSGPFSADGHVSEANGHANWVGHVNGNGHAEGAVPRPAKAKGGLQEGGDAVLWVTLDVLLTKLFSFIVANDDNRFVTTFFMTYRRFCTPLRLMAEFRTRFREVQDAPIAYDAKNWALMRITGALVDWLGEYPGDATHPPVRAILQDILAAALRHPSMAHLTKELAHIEAGLSEVQDVDTSWSLGARKRASSQSGLVIDADALYEIDSSTSASGASAPTTPHRAHAHDNGHWHGNGGRKIDSLPSLGASEPDEVLRVASGKRQSGEERSAAMYRHLSQGSGGSNGAGASGEDMGFGKWAHAFGVVVAADPRVFAVDLTRMQWQRFRSIRPRDILRHDLGKETDDPVAQAILFFNHLSRWVTTLILANPKAKHRARVYEKFLLIAHYLRRLNNYDSLYAVISGMKETSVHRLAATHALLGPATPAWREFQSHVKLMDPRGGYMLYRRALEADIGHGTAAIPLMTNILGLVSRLQTVRRDDTRDADGAVQWDKFAKFGQMLAVVAECQDRGPIVPGDVGTSFRALIEETPVILNEDGLFERSRMLEPPSGAGMGGAQQGARVLRRLAGLAQ